MRIKYFIAILLLANSCWAIEEQDAAPRMNTSTLAQLEEIKEQMKAIRGELEQLQFSNTQLNEKLAKLSSDVEFRFNSLETQTKEKDVFAEIDEVIEGDDQSIEKPTEKEGYNRAYASFKAKNYKQAAISFKQFLKDHPKSEYSSSAHYWLGETYFLNSEFDKSAAEYLKGYQSDDKGKRAPENLIKLGRSLAKLEKTKEACTTFAKVKKEFPNSSTAFKKELEAELKNLKCAS